MSAYPRYAIYFAPRRDEPLYDFGSRWFGRDIETGAPVGEICPDGLPDGIKSKPAIYGFHATLKPPFALKDGETEESLCKALSEVAASLEPSEPFDLDLALLGNFVALRPNTDASSINAIAERMVLDLEPFRAALSPEDLTNRRSAELSSQQEALLEQWGYPYVLQEFRFHITLTDSLSDADKDIMLNRIAEKIASIPISTTMIQDLCILKQPAQHERFQWLARFPLLGEIEFSDE